MKYLTALVLVCCIGCSKPAPKTATLPAYNPPEVPITASTAIDEKLGEINPENRGYIADMDGDGVPDFVIMHDNTLFYSRSQKEPQIPILKLKGKIIAYRIDMHPKVKRPSLIFFDEQRKGYLQENLGANDKGIPYFGSIEAIE
jgi:hypothetical protein